MTPSGIRLLSPILALLLLPARVPAAESHIVTTSDLHRAAVAASGTRQQNRQAIERLLSMPRAESVLRTTGIEPGQVKAAVSTLDDRELSRLAAQAQQLRQDFAAGRLTDRDLLLILIGLAALILIIVAVD